MVRQLRLPVLAVAAAGILTLAGCGASGSGGSGNADVSSADLHSALDAAAKVKLSSGASTVPFQEVKPGSGKGLKIGYIALDDSNSFVHLITQSIESSAKTAGAQLAFCDAKGDSQTALNCAQTFKATHVDGYINYQSDATAAASICAAGPSVPVIAMTTEQKPCQVSLTGADNKQVGELAGEAVGNYFKSAFNCKYDAFVSLENLNGGQSNQDRMGGYRDGFESVCGKVHDLKQENAINIDTARTVMADVLTALPGRHRIIVVGTNDADIEGALAAAKTASRTDDLYVSGQGADSTSWCAMKANDHWIGDAAFFPEKWGTIAIPYMIQAIDHQNIPSTLYVPTQVVNGSNVDAVYHPSC